jgi:trimethylamine:corrinoid methyltransferase-like protein
MTNWNDKQEVLEAVKQNGMALRFASEELRADKEIVLAAVKQSDKAFRYVSDELKADKNIVIVALNHKHYWLLRYTTEELLEVIKRNGNSLEPLSDLVRCGST